MLQYTITYIVTTLFYDITDRPLKRNDAYKWYNRFILLIHMTHCNICDRTELGDFIMLKSTWMVNTCLLYMKLNAFSHIIDYLKVWTTFWFSRLDGKFTVRSIGKSQIICIYSYIYSIYILFKRFHKFSFLAYILTNNKHLNLISFDVSTVFIWFHY